MQKIRFAYLFGVLLVVAQLFFNFSNNPPNGKAGAPGDGTCADCHSGGSFNGTMSVQGLPATVTPNTTYTVTMTNSFSGAAPDLTGFQITARTASNAQAGLVDNASPSATITNFGGKDYVEHNPAEFFGGNNSVSWQFDWTAPSGTDGEEYTFYYSGVFADGTGGTGNDLVSGGIFQTTLDVPEPLTASTFVIQNVSCNGENDGSAGVTPNGGTPPYFFSWSTGDSGATVSNLPAGTHTVTIDDVMGQQTTAMVTIVEPNALGIMLIGQTDVNCLTEGGAIVVGQGGTPGYNYAWSNGGGGATQSFTAGGNYEVTVSDNVNCTQTLQVNIGEDLNTPNADAGQAATLTCIESSVTLDGSASSSNSGQLGYLWIDATATPISNTVTAMVSSAGLYTLVVADTENGCTSSAFVTVLENTNAPMAAASASGDLDCVNTFVTLTATASNFQTTLEWIDMTGSVIGTTENIDVNEAGQYTLVVTNVNNGCTSQAGVIVNSNADTPDISATVSGTLSCENSTVTLVGTTGSQGNYTYEWIDANNMVLSTDLTTTVQSAGTYTFSVVDGASGCFSQTSVSVSGDSQVPEAMASNDETLNCNTTTINLDGTGSSTGENIAYEWFTDTISMATSISTNLMVDVTTPNEYILMVTNTDNGCLATDTVLVNQQLLTPLPNAGADVTLTCASVSVTLQGSDASGENNVTYEWFDSSGMDLATTTILEVEQPGVYTLVVTNTDSGCTASDDVAVAVDDNLPIADAGSSQVLNCTIATVSLDGTGSSSGASIAYEWSDANGMVFSTAIIAEVSQAGIYTLTVTDEANGCTSSNQVEVTLDTEFPFASAVASGDLTCANTSVFLDGNLSTTGNNIAYEWMDENGAVLSNSTMAEVSQAGSYTLIVTNTDNSCVAQTTVVVSENIITPSLTIPTPDNLDCSNPSVMITPTITDSNDFTCEWTDENGTIINTDCNITVSQAGTFTLTVTDNDSACTTSQSVVVQANTGTVQAAATAFGVLTCDDGTVLLNGSGSSAGDDIVYSWLAPDMSMISTDFVISVNEPGVYTFIVTNTSTGCSNQVTVTAEEDINVPIADAGLAMQLTCSQASLVLDGTASSSGDEFTYEWTSQDGTIVSGETTLNPTINTSGIYTLVVTNVDNACTVSSAVEVTEAPMDINLISSQTNVLCFGGNSGTAIVEATGGTAPYIYNWSTGATTATINNLIAGTYSVEASDSNGCQASLEVTITVPESLSLQIASTDESAPNANDGIATASLSGGTAPYDYAWSNGATMAAIENLAAGTYTVTATDANGCALEQNVDINSGECTVSISATATDASCSGEQDGTATVTIEGTNGNFMINWSNGDVTTDATGLGAGTYTVVVTDALGCEDSAQVTVSEPNPIVVDIVEQTEVDCENPFATATIMASGGVPPYTYSWSDGFNGTSNDMLAIGTYSIEVMDANNCTETIELTITGSTDIPQIDIIEPEILTCTTTEILLAATITTEGNYEVVWNTTNGAIVSGEATETLTISSAGTYCIRATNLDTGCERITCVDVQEDIEAPIADAGTDITITCSLGEGNIDASGSSMGADYIYLWSTVDGNIISGESTLSPIVVEPGEYCLTVTNTINGCTATDCMFILEDATFPEATVSGDFVLTCVNTETVLTLDATPDTNIDLIEPDGIVTMVSSDVITLTECGTYQLVATSLTNGCTSSSSFEITCDMEVPVADAGADIELVLNCYNPNPTAILDWSGSSTGGNLSYDWTTTDGQILDAEMGEVTAGTYALAVTNLENGCVDMDTVVVTLFEDALPPSIDLGGGIITCEFPFLIEPVSQGGNIAYAWRDANGTILSTDLAFEIPQGGTYTLTATNLDNGCSSSETIVIEEALNIVEANITDANDGANDGAIDINVTGGSSPYIYEWSNGETTEDISGLAVGEYSVVIQDANGCEYVGVFEVQLSTSVIELSQNTNITLFPNPNQGQFSIQIENAANEAMRFEIVDFTGKIVQQNAALILNNNQKTINANALSAGIYMVNFYTNNGLIASKKIMVTK